MKFYGLVNLLFPVSLYRQRRKFKALIIKPVNVIGYSCLHICFLKQHLILYDELEENIKIES